MTTIKKLLTTTHLIVTIFVIVIVLAIIIYTNNNNNNAKFYYSVVRGDITQSVQFTGTIEGVDQIELAFNRTGKVDKIFKKQGEHVTAGTIIATLDQSSIIAELAQAEASVTVAKSDVAAAKANLQKADAGLLITDAQNRVIGTSFESAKNNLEKTTKEQQALVSAAKKALLNNDLQAYSIDTIRNYNAPIISGTYNSSEEGAYNISFYHSNSRTGFSANYSGLETGTISFNDFGTPEQLGTHGLYIILPESGSTLNYSSTEWTVPIPNNRSSTYYKVLDSYKKAKETADRTIAISKAEYETLKSQENNFGSVPLSVAQTKSSVATKSEASARLEQAYGKLLQAQAQVKQIKVELENGVLRTPIDGIVAKLDLSYGEYVTTSKTSVTIIGNNSLELDAYIPELDVAKVSVGDNVTLTIDALPKEIIFNGVLSQIDSVSSEIDGVPAYKTTVTLLDTDERVRAGMNAHAKVKTLQHNNVLVIPAQYITLINGNSYVTTLKDSESPTQVTVGARGTNGLVEIIDGITEGETILPPTKS